MIKLVPGRGVMSLLVLLSLGFSLRAQVPGLVTYEGRVQADGVSLEGKTQFKFAIVDASPGSQRHRSFWSNDGTIGDGSEPGAHVELDVSDGYFTVVLGQDMEPLPASIFASSNRALRVWVNDGEHGFEQMVPDLLLTSSPYALMAGQVQDGAVGGPQLAPDAVGPQHIGPGALDAIIPDHLELGDEENYGSLCLFHTDLGGPSMVLDGDDAQIVTFGDDGLERVRLAGGSWANLVMRDEDGNHPTVQLSAYDGTEFAINQEGGGGLRLWSRDGDDRAWLWGAENGGRVRLYGKEDGMLNAQLRGTISDGGRLELFDDLGRERLLGLGEPGELQLLQGDGDFNLVLTQTSWGGRIHAYDEHGVIKSSFGAGSTGGNIQLYNAGGEVAIGMNGDGSDANLSGGGLLRLGAVSSHNVVFDNNEILARNDGNGSTLVLNASGGGVAIGSGQVPSGYKLSVDGAVICEELVVQLSDDWPDYVFAEGYALMPLEELEESIAANKHLPGIPKASEVEKEGITVGAMQTRMMEKIEELTLYLLEQNRQLKAQRSEIEALTARLNRGN